MTDDDISKLVAALLEIADRIPRLGEMLSWETRETINELIMERSDQEVEQERMDANP